MVRGDYAEALAWAVRSLALNPRFDPTYWMLIAANAHLGHMAEARRFLQELRAIAPEVTVASIRAGQPTKDPAPRRGDPRGAADRGPAGRLGKRRRPGSRRPMPPLSSSCAAL